MAAASIPNAEMVGEYRVIEDKAHRLGTGSGGSVYLAKHATIENKFAAAKKTSIYKEFLVEGAFEKEADLLMNKIPPHENIIKVYDFIKKEYVEEGVQMIDIWLVMEYAKLGSLRKFAQQNNLSIEKKVELMFQSALGVKHLHECKPKPVAHQDIKPENILITGSVENPIARISDFGTGKTVLQISGRSVTMTSLSGTPSYAAPEQTQLHGGKFVYDKSVDIYSLGVTFQSLLDCSQGKVMTPKTLNGKSIGQAMWEFSTLFNVQSFSVNIDGPSDSSLEKAIKDIIKNMIQLKPCDRMPISEVVERLSVLRSSSAVEKMSELRVSTPLLVAVHERSVWVKEGSTWKELEDMPREQPYCGVCYCILSDGIVSVGGCNGDVVTSVCHHFSLLTRCWTRLADMATARRWASAVMVDGILLVLGGMDNDGCLAVCERFHINDGVWSPAASLRESLVHPLVAIATGKVFVLPRDTDMPRNTRIMQYDPDTDEFSQDAPLLQLVKDTYGCSLVGVGDQLYLLGGGQKLVLQYSLASRQWTELLSDPSARYGNTGCCGVVLDDKLLLCGGWSENNDWNVVEEFDPHTQQWDTAYFTLPIDFYFADSLVGVINV